MGAIDLLDGVLVWASREYHKILVSEDDVQLGSELNERVG